MRSASNGDGAAGMHCRCFLSESKVSYDVRMVFLQELLKDLTADELASSRRIGRPRFIFTSLLQIADAYRSWRLPISAYLAGCHARPSRVGHMAMRCLRPVLGGSTCLVMGGWVVLMPERSWESAVPTDNTREPDRHWSGSGKIRYGR
jgi:hypothetical protein